MNNTKNIWPTAWLKNLWHKQRVIFMLCKLIKYQKWVCSADTKKSKPLALI